MQHDDLISIAEAARAVGLNRSTLTRQVRLGTIRSYGGKVRLSEVLEDRANNIDLSRAHRGKAGAAFQEDVGDGVASEGDATNLDATDPDATEAIDPDVTIPVDGKPLPYAQARALKETYLAKLRQLEYDQKSGAVVLIDDAVMVMTSELLVIRNRLLGLPNKMAPVVSRLGVEQARDALHKEVVTILAELSSGEAIVTKAGGKIDPTPEKHA